MAWSITPTDATINNDGVANFPPNETSSDKPYTITYTDNNGCTATTTYTVTPTSVCSCSNISANYTSHSFNATGGTITAATITSPCTTSNFTVSDVPTWLTTGTTSDGITLKASENTSSSARPTETIKFMLNGSTQCFTIDVSQKALAICDCNSFSITPETQSKMWEYDEYDFLKKATWIISPDCMTITLDNTEDFTMTVNSGLLGKVINVYPKQQNDGYTTKSGKITITGWDGTNVCFPVGGVLNLRQKGQTPPPEEGIMVVVTVASYTDQVQYEHPSWAYTYYSTSDGNDIPFEILVRPLISIQEDGHPCEPAITWQEKAAFWDNNQYPDPNYHTDVWPAGGGHKICSIKIDTVWANGSEVTNRQTITVSGQKYTIMWSSL